MSLFSNLLNDVASWFEQHPWIAGSTLGLSLLTLLAGLVFVPWVVVRIPPDYFAHNRRLPSGWGKLHPALHFVVVGAKNLLGGILVVAGFIMLFVPGPGIVSILVGLALVDIPGKRSLERWIVARPTVFAALNKLRARYNHPPLQHP